MGRLDGKVALITGAASNPGLGYSTALRLAEEGAKLVVTDIDEAGAAACAVTAMAAAFEFRLFRLSVDLVLLKHDEMTSFSATRRHIFSRLRRDCGAVAAIARRIASN